MDSIQQKKYGQNKCFGNENLMKMNNDVTLIFLFISKFRVLRKTNFGRIYDNLENFTFINLLSYWN